MPNPPTLATPPALLLCCPGCERVYGELTKDGNQLEMPGGGWTNFRYHCVCLWCRHAWTWVPARDFRTRESDVLS